jgi:hypothetical protein
VVSAVDSCLCLVADFAISDVEASGPVTSNITWLCFRLLVYT